MDLAGQSQRLIAATLIVAVHAVGLYALTTVGPQRKQVTARAPVIARIISSSEPQRPKFQPPAIKPVPVTVTAAMPELAFIEIPIATPSPNAISVAVRSVPPSSTSEDRSAPKLISTVEYLREPSPRYPPQSRRLREQGLVVLRVVIDERGTACQIEIESSSGYARLDHAARDAVQRAAFRPYVEDGAPRRALVLIPIEFSLRTTV